MLLTRNLYDLNLEANSFNGTLSASKISGMTNAEKINLGFNEITGEIPDTFVKCTMLYELKLHSNKLTGISGPSPFCWTTLLLTIFFYFQAPYQPFRNTK
eukprot:TRINITY_DN2627_c0_g1_i10.p5 TRINITY_DN2627_c0_g1~~TRINITY_DN2627_c0_g1_i10.p5  ORF type:complete len:100 (+),score=9.09 TRINITY_DN2627_c0_g1_i10:317-616(+)